MAEAADVIDLTLDDSSDEEGQPAVHGNLNDVPRAHLLAAIDTVPELRLRQIIKKLVDEEPAFERALLDELVAVKKRTHEAMSRWGICDNCEEEFDVSELRYEEECTYHTGGLEVDVDQFADHDERCHGPMDTEENRRSFPQGFYWNCCEGQGADHPGCEVGQHVPRTPETKRRRI